MTNTKLPRGLRNNNPGNIVKGEQWQGLAKEQLDDRFCSFISMVYGCRALLKLLNTYVNKYKCTTIEQIINRYAPSHENNTSAYINYISSKLNTKYNTNLQFSSELYVKLAKAIVEYENGKIANTIISDDIWNQAIELANL